MLFHTDDIILRNSLGVKHFNSTLETSDMVITWGRHEESERARRQRLRVAGIRRNGMENARQQLYGVINNYGGANPGWPYAPP